MVGLIFCLLVLFPGLAWAQPSLPPPQTQYNGGAGTVSFMTNILSPLTGSCSGTTCTVMPAVPMGLVGSISQPPLILTGPTADPSPSPSPGSFWYRADLVGAIGTAPTPAYTPLGRVRYRDSQGARSLANIDDLPDLQIGGLGVTNGFNVGILNFDASDFASSISCSGTPVVCGIAVGPNIMRANAAIVTSQLPTTAKLDNNLFCWGTANNFCLRYNSSSTKLEVTNNLGTVVYASFSTAGAFASTSITAPAITDFTNMTHNHTANNQGGVITLTRQRSFSLFDTTTKIPINTTWKSMVPNIAVPITITQVCCEAETTGACMQLQRNDTTPVDMLNTASGCSNSGNLECGNNVMACTSSFVGTEYQISTTDNIDFLTKSNVSSKRYNVAIKYTIP